MFQPGQMVMGWIYTDEDRILVKGKVLCRTNDSEEMWQAYYIEDVDGNVYCCDEQEVLEVPELPDYMTKS